MVGRIRSLIRTSYVVLPPSGFPHPREGRLLYVDIPPPVVDWVAIWITSFTYGSYMYHY